MGPAFTAVEDFIGRKIWGVPKGFLGDTALAVVDGQNLAGAIVYHNYDPENGVIEMSSGAGNPRWFTRAVLREMFAYPFNDLGCRALVTRCDAGDAKLERIFGALGFSRHVLPGLRRDGDEAVYILTRDAWRAGRFYQETTHGKKSPRADAAA